MRVLHLIARLNDGGPVRVLRQWGQWGVRAGHQVRVLCGPCTADEPDMQHLLDNTGMQVEVLEQMGRRLQPLRDLQALRLLQRRLRELRPDILHTHTAKAGMLGRLLARHLHIPCLHTYHGHVLDGYWHASIHRLISQVEGQLGRWADHHSLTPHLVRTLALEHRIGHPKRWHCAPIPIAPVTLSPPAQRPQIAADLGLQGYDPRLPCIGFLGRLVPVKDPQLAIAALRLLAQQQPIQCLICGDGPLREALQAALDSLPCPAWSCGFVPAEKALSLFDALLMSSRNEGVPLALIEALGGGIGVAACAVGGIVDLQAGPALRLCARDPRDLSAALASLLATPAPLRQAHAQQVLSSWDPDQACAQIFAIYQGMLKRAVPQQGPAR